MRLENQFHVPASADDAWRLLNDVPSVIPCMPGARLDEVVDADHWKATMQVKLGPIALEFATDVERSRADEAARTVVLTAKARERRGRGGAHATIESSLGEEGDGTSVTILTDLQLQGTVAQYGRGIVADVSSQLTSQFADCIAAKLAAESPSTPDAAPAPPPAPAPVGGLRLLMRALRQRLRGLLRRRSPR
jgi:uncharacterized protein